MVGHIMTLPLTPIPVLGPINHVGVDVIQFPDTLSSSWTDSSIAGGQRQRVATSDQIALLSPACWWRRLLSWCAC